MHRALGSSVSVRFAMPSEVLRPYVTTYYLTQSKTAEVEPVIEDYLHPEWANLRFLQPKLARSSIGDQPLRNAPAFSVTGPTSKATRFQLQSGRSWGIGLLPQGWARFVGVSATYYADRFVDGRACGEFSAFWPLADKLEKSSGNFAAELALIEAHMASMLDLPAIDEEAILAVNSALVESGDGTVAGLAQATGLNIRTLERLCQRHFGFPPKLLLRRQRFLRSLAQFMLDPTLKWLNAMDCQYHDQAQFVRDFQRFMGMSPRAYGRLEHPLMRAAARARAEIAGEAVQGLHNPKF